jgi:predicted signal transduction protein with EAL and GGDEF domain
VSAAANSELALAAELGCTVAQSYHIALPMPADDLERWLAVRPIAGAPDRLARSWVHPVRAQL